MSKSRDQLNEFLKKINIDEKTVLDVGVQDKPTSRLTQGDPLLYVTLDIDEQWKPDILADLNYPLFYDTDGRVWQCKQTDDPDVIGEKIRDFNQGFDIVFCIEVLEHCWNPVEALHNLYKALEPGGVLYISTPFINPHHDYVDYLRYTNEWYRDVLPKIGFSDVKIKERVATTGKPMLKAFYQIEGLRVSKIRPEYGNYSYPIGYFVEARK